MTARQVAIAAAANLKWIVNSGALLRRRLRYNAEEARWWGLVSLLTGQLGLSLKAAAESATVALRGGTNAGQAVASADPSGSTSLIVDLGRYESIFLGNLSRALVHETPRRRGRPARGAIKRDTVTSAQDYGIDLGLIRSALARTPAERLALLEQNAAFLQGMRKRA